MITDNTAKWRVGSINALPTNSTGDGKLPIGFTYISMGSTAPAGSLPLWGQLFSRSTYKDLWEWVQLHPEQLVSESEWQTKYLENEGVVPFYSDGTDSTNFRLPNCTGLGTNKMNYVIEEGTINNVHYKLWKNGWLEQVYIFTSLTDYYDMHFPKSFKDTSYIVITGERDSNNHTDTGGFDGTVAMSGGKTYNSVRISCATGREFYIKAEGWSAETPVLEEKVLWCVKAFGEIESLGSTTATNIANNITALNTKVDNWVSGTLDSQATAIAEMQSYFTENMEETLLYSSLAGASAWDGNITFSDSYLNYDFIRIEFADKAAVASDGIVTELLNTKFLYKDISDAVTNRTSKYQINVGVSSWYWASTPANMTETYWPKNSNGSCYPRRVWGYKLKATGITNKSAIDVSQMQEKISSLLTSDNHLILPSGLEVW